MITRDEAARVAALAKLDMTGEELDRAARDLASILGYVAQIAEVDTSGIDADAIEGTAPPLRDDVPAPSLGPDATFANAPDADRAARLFRVPRVIGS